MIGRVCVLVLAGVSVAGCGAGGARSLRLTASTSRAHVRASNPPASPVGSATAAGLAKGHWLKLPRAPITPRGGASVVWTGHELIVWGGQSGANGQVLHGDGAAYDPRTGRWRALPAGPLSPRVGQTAVWTGHELVIWGGYDLVSPDRFHVISSGAAYDPAKNRWRLLPPAPLSARTYALGVWTGNRLVLLGGQPAVITSTIRGYGDGAVYDPMRNQWSHIAPPKRTAGHPLTWQTAVQTRGQVLAWSQWATSRRVGPNTSTSRGGIDLFAYSDRTGHWRLLPQTTGELPAVEEVLWTGRQEVVRGLPYNCGMCSGPFTPEVTALYDPERNTWIRLPPDPLGGDHLVSTWTGAALFSFDSEGQYGPVRPGSASAYDIHTQRWRRLPSASFGCGPDESPVWTGRQVLIYCPRVPAGVDTRHDGLAFTVGAK